MEIRAARAEEADDVLRVLCAAFSLPFDVARPIYYRDPFFDLSHKRLLRASDGGVVCCLTVIPARMRIGAAWVPLAGIAGVATQPTLQGRGYAKRLLADTIPALSDELHYPLSGLFALSERLYRHLGWETVSRSDRHSLPLPLHSTDTRQCDDVRPADEADFDAIRRLHAVTACRTGDCRRDDRRWRLIGGASGRECTVVGPVGGVTGYAFWERHADTVRLLELRGATMEARSHLIGFIAGRQPAAAKLDWDAPPSDLLAAGLHGELEEDTQEPGLMLRLTDLLKSLELIHGANLASVLAFSGRTLTVRAADPQRPKNDRPVRLTSAGVVPGLESDPDWIAADIRAFAPIYFGFHTPSEACEAGELTASSPEVLALADALFPRRASFVAPLDQF